MFPCLVIVSRDQPELLAALTSIYGHEGAVEIRFDRRHGRPGNWRGEAGDRRSPPSPDTDLQDDGFVVICRP